MKSKYLQVYEQLKKEIEDKKYSPGDKLPSETSLTQAFRVSRPTVTKALEMLQKNNLIVRKPKTGSFVLDESDVGSGSLRLGLLIPLLGTREIFEPICARIAQLSNIHNYTLLWSGSHAVSEATLVKELRLTCRKYIEQGVSGVFFVPLEFSPSSQEINTEIIAVLEDAGIKIVLLDADYLPLPHRSKYDLVGIDNFHCGFEACMHYLNQGASRVDFFQLPNSAYTVDMRLRGYRSALLESGINDDGQWIHIGEPEDTELVLQMVRKGAENIICPNDVTAVRLMHTLLEQGIRIPSQVRLIGFDDVKYVKFASIPLTTFRQHCDAIGELAVETMASRLQNPDREGVTISVPTELVVRKSSVIPKHN